MNKYLKTTLNVVLYILVLFVFSLIVSFGLRALIAAGIISQETRALINENMSILSALLAIMLIPIYMLIFRVKKQKLFEFINTKPISIKAVGLIAIVAAAMGFFSTSFLKLSFIVKLVPELEETVSTFMDPKSIVIILLTSVLIVPAFEEILFRGMIFTEMKKTFPLWLALVLQSLVYALFQPNIGASVFGFVGGIMFALVYLWYESIWAPILLQVISCFFMLVFRRIALGKLIGAYGDISVFAIIIISIAIIVSVMMTLNKNSKIKSNIKA